MKTRYGVDSKDLALIFGVSEAEVMQWRNLSNKQMDYVTRASVEYMAKYDEDIRDAYKMYKDRPTFTGDRYYTTEDIAQIFHITKTSIARAFARCDIYGWKVSIHGKHLWITTKKYILKYAKANERRGYLEMFNRNFYSIIGHKTYGRLNDEQHKHFWKGKYGNEKGIHNAKRI